MKMIFIFKDDNDDEPDDKDDNGRDEDFTTFLDIQRRFCSSLFYIIFQMLYFNL